MNKKKREEDTPVNRTVNFKKKVRWRMQRRIIPVSLGITFVASLLIWLVLSENNIINMTGAETFASFVVLPAVIALTVCLIVVSRTADILHEKMEELGEAVQRLSMGHYDRIRHRGTDELLLPLTGELEKVAAQFVEKEARVESIGRKCDQLEAQYERETCRWMGASVNPEMAKTVLEGIRNMALEERCEDIISIVDDVNQVLMASLENAVSLRPLADELGRIKRFLEIYETVYDYKVGYRMSIMCNIVSYRIIPNLVLPVVQLLFDRARASGCEDYEIGVEVNSSFTNMLIIVRDNNGANFLSSDSTADTDDDISRVVNDDTASRTAEDGAISIGALNRRVASYYGSKYTVKQSGNRLGSAVYIYLPPVSGTQNDKGKR